jgi:hypothetical protein
LIDRQLPDYHEAFRNPQAHFDPTVGHYVATLDEDNSNGDDGSMFIASVPALNSVSAPVLRSEDRPGDINDGDNTNDDSDDSTNSAGVSVALRQPPPEAAAMKFWALIFDDALENFKTEKEQPKGRPEIYNIRAATNWNAVYERLQLAREVYDDTKKDFWGRVKQQRRRVAEYAGPVRGLAKFLPDGTYTSPVRAAVQVILDVGGHCAVFCSIDKIRHLF